MGMGQNPGIPMSIYWQDDLPTTGMIFHDFPIDP